MSVNVDAKIVYGFIVDRDEAKKYFKYCDDNELEREFYHDSYNYYRGSIGVFGVIVESTRDICVISSVLEVDECLWKQCLDEWYKIFPERVDDEPQLILMTEWW